MFLSRMSIGDPENVLLLYHGVAGQGMASFKAFPGPFWASPHLKTSLSLSFFKMPFLEWISIPTSFVSLFIFYILSYLILKTTGCLSGCLMSSASIQKLFCGICSAFKCSFNEFVGDKLFSPSYSSAIPNWISKNLDIVGREMLRMTPSIWV